MPGWQLTLDAESGPDDGTRFQFVVDREIVFGREGKRDTEGLRPSDPRISRRHVCLFPTDEGVVVRHAMEGKQVLVGGEPVKEGLLSQGTSLQLGESAFRVSACRVLEDTPPKTAVLEEIITENVTVRPLDELHLLDEIGRGAAGRVVRARDPDGRVLCVKLVHRDSDDPDGALPFFLREIDLLGGLVHPNIVRTLCAGASDDEMYLGMEWIDGRNLDEEVALLGPLSLLDACSIGRQLLSALICAHDAGIVHRDVKPLNIMIRGRRGSLHATLIDFGLARIAGKKGDAGLTSTGEARGTLAYAALETLTDAKRAGPAVDLFSVGATLYSALTTGYYYDAKLAAANIANVVGGRNVVPIRDRRADVPASLARVIEKSLALEPEARWSSASEMLEQIVLAEGEVRRVLGGLL